MATTFTMHDDRLGVGQTVSVYAAAPYAGFAPSGVPGGTLVTSAVVAANGTVAFTGLTDNTSYYAYAQVGGVNIYVGFRTTPVPSGGGGGSTITSTQQTGAAYTFTAGDAGTRVEGNRATAQQFTIPPGLPLGSAIEVFQRGAGQITILGPSVTLNSNGNKVATAAQKSTIGLLMSSLTQDDWTLSGDLA